MGFLIRLSLQKNNTVEKILIIGNGNVAFHLKKLISQVGYHVVQSVEEPFDMVIFSIRDDVYEQVVNEFPVSNTLMLHTSGSVPSEIFTNKTKRFGVLYPFQTFNKNSPVNFNEVPAFVTASNTETELTILNLANRLFGKVSLIDDRQRLILHLTGVFANNFTNHMVAIAQKLLQENKLNADSILPLLKKTFRQLEDIPAAELQTGPAKRNDLQIIEKHLKLLDAHPEFQKIYKFVSESIKNYV